MDAGKLARRQVAKAEKKLEKMGVDVKTLKILGDGALDKDMIQVRQRWCDCVCPVAERTLGAFMISMQGTTSLFLGVLTHHNCAAVDFR